MGRRRHCARDKHCRSGGGALNIDLWGARATSGVVIDANTVEIRFSKCVSISANTGIEVDIDGAGFVQVTGNAKVSDTVWRFTTGTIMAGDTVQWRYVGGSNSIVDCDKAEDIGDQGVNVVNDLMLEGNFWLLETGGRDIFLLEDDSTGEDGWLTEDAP